jgi:hypothetical protein
LRVGWHQLMMRKEAEAKQKMSTPNTANRSP